MRTLIHWLLSFYMTSERRERWYYDLYLRGYFDNIDAREPKHL